MTFREQGKSYREISKLLNTSAPTIMRMLRRNAIAQKCNVTNSNQNGIESTEKTEGVT